MTEMFKVLKTVLEGKSIFTYVEYFPNLQCSFMVTMESTRDKNH